MPHNKKHRATKTSFRAEHVGSSSDSHDEPSTNHVEGFGMRTPLSLEVAKLILDDMEDRILLNNVALVSRVWCRAAQAKMFYGIVIDCRQSSQFWSRKFKRCLHLRNYVRELELSDPDDDCMSMPYLLLGPEQFCGSGRAAPGQTFPVGDRSNIKGMKSRDLPDLLYSLPNVDTLRLGPLSYVLRELPPIREAGSTLRQRLPEDGKSRKLEELQLHEAELSIDYLMWLTGPAFDLSDLDKFHLS
ncbi:hypothetical protein Moror_11415 [Moniliophthora roreri MCA 2997]|uniref:F-box domain-containing protein n=1 Tax=Moniliophthora roreri (strain MCA 2997) TaxID=1381753 RepID=V2WVD4_MONRO|nr:hypothetical protein Moror_11415 [Moniliophthora roreri MCA 2997]